MAADETTPAPVVLPTRPADRADSDPADGTSLRALFDRAPEAMILADDEGRYLEVNAAACAVFGRAREELLGRTPPDFAAGEYDTRDAWTTFLRDGSLRGVFPMRRPDGEVRELEFSAIAGILPGRHLSILRDVTAARAHSERLTQVSELAAAVTRAGDLDEIYRLALSGLKRTLKADRAAVLVYDDDGALRFKAWDGLPDHYRQAAEGHSPWKRTERNPLPVLVPRVEEEPSLAALSDFILAEGIRALGFIPLTAGGALIGKLMIYYDAPHPFSKEEVRLASTVASQIAFAIERQRREEELRRRDEELTDFVENATVALHSVGADGRILWANRAELELLGYSREHYVGRFVTDFHVDRRAGEEMLGRLARGETLVNYEAQLRARDGSIRDVLISSSTFVRNGRFVHTRCFTRDITERKQTTRRQRMHFEITRVLAEARELGEAAPRLLSAICETLGWDGGAVWRVDEEARRLRCLEFWHAPGRPLPRFEAASRDRTYASGVGMPGRIWARRAPTWITDILEDSNFPSMAAATSEGLRSACGFPILARGEVLGVIEFFSRAVRPPDSALMTLLADVGSRVGQFVERRRAEEAIRASEARYRVLFENTLDALLIVDESGQAVQVNETLCRVLKSPRDHLLGRSLLELTPPERAAEAKEAAESLKRTGTFSGEFPLRAADGTTVELEWMSLANFVPGLFFWSARDVTARKRSEERERFLADASAVLAGTLDYETTLANVARLSVPAIADWCVVDLLERDGSLRRLAVAHESPEKVELAKRYRPKPGFRRGVQRVLETGNPILLPEVTDEILQEAAQDAEHLEILRRQGVRSAMSVPLISSGRPFGVLTFITAESARVYGPADLRLAAELASRAGLAIENARLYREAEEASAQKSRFLSAVSHDLRTPVNAILLNSVLVRQLAERRAGAEDGLAERCRRIEAAARSFADLLTNLLEIGTFESGQKTMRNETFSLRALLEEIVATFLSSARAKGLELTLRLEHRGDLVRADRTELSRVVTNLLSNALKFTETGGVRLETEDLADGGATIRVRDTGPGIRPEDLPALFSEFFQVRNPERDRRKGTGLGLAISRRIMATLGGTLTAESRPGEGSVFNATLPASRVSAGPVPASAEPVSPPPAAAGTILIIDDDLVSREALAALLAEEGYGVRIAAGGQEGLAALQEYRPDVVLLDMMMPGLDGLEVLRRVRSEAGTARPSVIAVTGDVTRERVERARAAGVDEFLAKPFDLANLLEILRRVIARA